MELQSPSAGAWRTAAAAGYWMVVGAAVMLLVLDWAGLLKRGGCDCEDAPAPAPVQREPAEADAA